MDLKFTFSRIFAVVFFVIGCNASYGKVSKTTTSSLGTTNVGASINNVYIDKSVNGFPVNVTRTPAFQLISHGRPGELLLDGKWRDASQIVSFLQEEHLLAPVVKQLNVYGCEFAKGQKGLAAVKYLEQHLGLNVSASTNITGKDGDWVLEVGKVTDVISMPAYAGNLQYAPGNDFDNDGIINSLDLDDDNDGVPDFLENAACTDGALGSGNVAPLTWDDAGATSVRNQTNTTQYLTNVPVTAGTDAFTGSGMTVAITSGFWHITNVDATTFSQAVTNNEYIQFPLQTKSVSSSFLELKGWTTNRSAAINANVPENFTIQIADNAAFTNPYTLSTVAGYTSSGTTLVANDFQNKFSLLTKGTTYYVRIYYYNVSGGNADQDGFGMYFNCYTPLDTDGDGILNSFDRDSDGDGCYDAYESGVTGATRGTGAYTDSLAVNPATPTIGVGVNGLKDVLETAPDNGILSYTDTYYLAKNASFSSCKDTDGDGIPDLTDIDDDNDGVPDVTEQTGPSCSTSVCNSWVEPPFTTASVSGSTIVDDEMVNYTITKSGTALVAQAFATTPYQCGLGNLVGVPSWQRAQGGETVTFTFSKPITNFQLVMSAIESGTTAGSKEQVTITTNNVFGQQKICTSCNLSEVALINGQTTTIAATGTAPEIFRVTGVAFTTISITVSSVGGSFFLSYGLCALKRSTDPLNNYTDLDTDGDGISNRLDLDSDGDGCSDLMEAGVSPATDIITPASTTNAVGGNWGIAANKLAGSQLDPNATDANNDGLNDSVDPDVNGSVNYTSSYYPIALAGGLKKCIDSDGDGNADLQDIDDDNDGITNEVESPNCFYTISDLKNTTFITSDLPFNTSISLALDGNTGTNASATNGAFVTNRSLFTFSFPLSNLLPLSNVTIQTGSIAGFSASNFQLQGWNGTSWEVLSASQAMNTASTTYTFTNTLFPSKAYNTFRIFGLAGQTANTTIVEANFTFSQPFVNSMQPKATCLTDSDGDGVLNHFDLDSDGDGCSDLTEAGVSPSTDVSTPVSVSNANGTSWGIAANRLTGSQLNPTATDANNDGLNDSVDPDVNGVTNYTSTYNNYAIYSFLNVCADSDGDGIPDLTDIDDDNDGIIDIVEAPGCYYTQNEAATITATSQLASAIGSPSNTTDKNIATYNSFNASTNWVGLELYRLTPTIPIAISNMQLDLTGWPISNGAGSTFRMQGSTDGSSWTDLSGNVASTASTGTFTISNTQSTPLKYAYYRLLGIAGTSNNAGVTEIRLTPYNYSIQLNPKPTCATDTDGDGIPNNLDLDSDGDGCSDLTEAGVSPSTDVSTPGSVTNAYGNSYGIAANKLTGSQLDPTATDANNDGLNDSVDPDQNGVTNYISTYKTNAVSAFFNACADSDGDGVNDLGDIDDDNDGIIDADEASACYYTSAEAAVVAKVSTGLASSNVNNIVVVPGADIATMHNGTTTTLAAQDHVIAAGQTSTTSSVIYTLEYPTSVKLSSVSVTGAAVTWGTGSFAILEGSIDGVTFNDTLSVPFATSSAAGTKTWNVTLNTNNYYQYYRIRVSTVGSTTPTFTNYEVSGVINATGYIKSLHPKATCATDTDGDGIANNLDLDSDGDGCYDIYEAGVPGATKGTGIYTDSLAVNPTTPTVGVGLNGLKDALETADNGVIIYTSTYNNYATSSSLSLCVDTDGDGIGDLVDLDDDNDGILDTNESLVTNLCNGNAISTAPVWTVKGYSNYNSSAASGFVCPLTLNPADVILTGTRQGFFDFDATGAGLLGIADALGAVYTASGNDNSRFGIELKYVMPVSATITMTFPGANNDLINIGINGVSQVCGGFSVTLPGSSVLNLNKGDTLSVFWGENDGNNTVIHIASSFAVCSTAYSDLDTDGDGIPNRLDLDSDGDGCPDAKEAGTYNKAGVTTSTSTSTYANGGSTGIVAGKPDAVINGPYGGNGFADVLQNVLPADTNSYKYTYDYIYAINTFLNVCADRDNDGIGDLTDIDDDNDGILDAVEAPTCYYTAAEWNTGVKPYNVSVSSELTTTLGNFSQLLDNVNNVNAVTFTASQPIQNKSVYLFTFDRSLRLDNLFLQFNTTTQFAGTTALQGSNNGTTWDTLSAAIAQTAATNVTIQGNVSVTNSLKYPVTLHLGTAYKYFRITGIAASTVAAQNASEVYFDMNASYVSSAFPKSTCSSDNDNDGITNQLDLDSDGDGCYDIFESGVTGATKGTGTYTDSLAVNPATPTVVGTNGLKDALETVADNGTINYTSTYTNYATSSSLNVCLDTDADGIGDLVDIDDDNDGILDVAEGCTKVPEDLRKYTWTTGGTMTYTVGADSILVTAGSAWSTRYTNDTLSLPLSLSWTAPSADQLMFGLIPKNGTQTPGNYNDASYKFYHDGGATTYGYFPTAWSSTTSVGSNTTNTYQINISATGVLTASINGAQVYTTTGLSTGSYRLALSYGGGSNNRLLNIKLVNPVSLGLLSCTLDTDGDGITNNLDLDSDGDGCPDAKEAGTYNKSGVTTTASTATNANGASTGIVTGKPDAVINGPYSGNGFADVLQNVLPADTNSYKYAYTYNYAASSFLNVCADTDNDGIPDLTDIDDDNDGVLDATEAPNCYYTAAEWNTGVKPYNVSVSSELTTTTGNFSQLLDNVNNVNAVTFTASQPIQNKSVYLFTFDKALRLDNLFLQFNTATQFAGNTALQGSNNGTTWDTLSAAIAQTVGTNATTQGSVSVTNSIKYPVTLHLGTAYKYFRITGIAASNVAAQNASEVYFDMNASYVASAFPKNSCTTDTDGDGITNDKDLDSDGDGCYDTYEGGVTGATKSTGAYTDSLAVNPATPNVVGSNGLNDALETFADNGIINYTSIYATYATTSSLSLCLDTDGDGIADLIDIDDDNDGVLDVMEQTCNASPVIPDDIPTAAASPEAGKNSFTNGFYDGTLNKPGLNSSSSWSAPSASTSYYVGVKFAQPSRITAINTQGRNSSAQWVTSYKLEATKQTIANGSQGSAVTWTNLGTFTANTDYTSTVINNISNTDNDWTAIRITPQTWSGHPSIRFSVTLCNPADLDTDGDGISNRLDLDSDADGCSDAKEAGATTSNTANYQFAITPDANSNGLNDAKETGTTGTINYTSTYNTYAIVSGINACTDTDNDGIPDVIDIDDDNDGVLDTNEMNATCNVDAATPTSALATPAGFTAISLTTDNSGMVGTGSTATTNGPVTTSNAWYGPDNVTTAIIDYSVAAGSSASNVLIWATEASDVTTGGDGPIKDFTVTITYNNGANTYTTGLFTTAKPTGIGTPNYGQRFNFGQSFANVTKITLNVLNGWYDDDAPAKNDNWVPTNTVTINNLYNLTLAEVRIGCFSVIDMDTDGDGIVNRLDLDSDGDGCSDAKEAGATTSTTANYQFAITPDANANGLNDTKETGTTGNINYTSTYSNYAIISGLNACTDSDGDGVPDVIDLDDDNDGILDVVENPCLSPNFYESFGTGTVSPNRSSITQVGVPGASGGYTYNGTTNVQDGEYTIANYVNTTSMGSWWSNIPNLDAITPGGNAMIINGSGSTYAYTSPYLTNWYPGKVYTVSFYVRNGNNLGNFPNLTLITEDALGNQIDTLTTGGVPFTDTWVKFTKDITVNASGGRIRIKTNSPAGGGNDFYMDEIRMELKDPVNCVYDTDGDGIPNYLDLDSDGDGCSDALEAGSTTNTTPNYHFPITPDVNGNGLNDNVESGTSGTVNYQSTYNPNAINTSVKSCTDTDGDGIPDLLDIDDDNDGILDATEAPSCYYTQAEASVITGVSSDLIFDATNSIGRSIDNNNTTFATFNPTAQNIQNKVLFQFAFAAPVRLDLLTDTLNSSTSIFAASSQYYIRASKNASGPWDTVSALLTTVTPASNKLSWTIAATKQYQYYQIYGVSNTTTNNGNSVQFIPHVFSYIASANPKPTCAVDTDNDGITNDKDLDSDGDGCTDAVEAGTYNQSGVTTSSGSVKNGSGGVVTSTTTIANAIINGPYSGNGFADVLQNVLPADTNTYKYTYTYSAAADSTQHACCPVISNDTISAAQTICPNAVPAGLIGSTPTLLPASTPLYQWLSSTTSASAGFTAIATATAKDYSPAALTQTTYYKRIVYSTGCAASADTSAAIAITVSAGGGVGGSVAATQTICANTSPADIALSGNSGTVAKWQYSNDNFVADIHDIANTNTSLTSAQMGNLTGNTYYRAVVNGSCGSLNSASVLITVTPAPTAGTLSGNQTICVNGTTTFNATQSGGTWSSDNTGVATVNTSGIVTGVSGGTANIIYTVAGSGGCADATANRQVTVNALPVATIAYSGSPYSSGTGTANVTRTGQTGGTYSTTSGLTLNASSGAVNLNASFAGTYTVKYVFSNGNCQDSAFATIQIKATNDTVTVTPSCPTCPITVCTIVDDIDTAGGGVTYSTPCGTPAGYTVSSVSPSGCITYTPNGTVTDTARPCIVTCKNGICDTTKVILYPPPPTNDTVTATPSCPTCPVTVCVVTDDVNPTGATYSTPCGTLAGYTASTVSATGCVTYTPNGTVTDTQRTCIVICNNGRCDTTKVILYPPTPTNDTVTATPSCPTCPVTVCVVTDDVNPTGATYSTPCGTPAGYTASTVSATGCVTYTPNGTVTDTQRTCIVICNNGRCDTTKVILYPPIPTNDTVTATPSCPTCPVTVCVVTDDVNPTGATYSTPCGTPTGYTASTVSATGCVTYTPNGTVTDTQRTCIVICNNGRCDTTKVILYPPTPTNDTVTATPSCPTCPVTVCVVTDDVNPTGATYSTPCGTPTGYTASTVSATGCVTYTPNGTVTDTQRTCIVICNNGRCDTTKVILYPPIPTNDTVTATPSCPTCPVTVCVVTDDVNPTGATYSTPCGTPTGYTASTVSATGCVTYTPNGTVTDTQRTCIVICNNGRCDTTKVILYPPIPTNDTVTATPSCPTCPVTVCVVTDDVNPTGATYSTPCGTPTGYTASTVSATGCVTYTPNGTVTDTQRTCIVICNNGRCDTTKVILYPPTPTNDTVTATPSCPTCPVTVCVVTDDVNPTGATYSTPCGTPAGYTASTVSATGCVTYTPNGTVTDTQRTCIVICNNGRCDTTKVILYPPIPTNDTVTATPSCPTCPVTVCVVTDDVNPTGATYSTPCGTPTGYTASTVSATGCVTYTPNGTVTDTQRTCIVICNNGRCDTTKVILYPPTPTNDTVTATPSCPTCPVTVCVVTDDVNPTGATYSTPCGTPTGYTASTVSATGCVTYTPNGTVTDTQRTCIVICNNGRCDTTKVILYPPIPTNDTVTATPSCPTCPVTVCVVTDDVNPTGATYSTPCGTPTGYTASTVSATGCVTYTPTGTVTDTQRTCIVICNNGRCDTTKVILYPPTPTNDTVTATPSCPTCPVTVCVVTDDVSPTGATYSTPCGTPAGYTASTVSATGCVTYTPNGTVTDTVRTCIVICNNGRCDTTKVILYPPIPTNDTVTATPSCPTCATTVCVVTDDVNPTGATYSAPCGTPTGYTASTVSATGCVTYTPNGTVTDTVRTCIVICNNGRCDTTKVILYPPVQIINHDWNIGFVNMPITGNVRSNDQVNSNSTYGNVQAASGNPTPAIPTMNSNGTYTFTGTMQGNYQFTISVCAQGQTTNCPTQLLFIHVTDTVPDNNNLPIANLDMVTTPYQTAISIPTLSNDLSGNYGDSLNAGSVAITVLPTHGTVTSIGADGTIHYTPANGFIGIDTLIYSVCDARFPGNCDTAYQIIRVLPPGAANTTSASDDYRVTLANTPVAGNVLSNDIDPEGNGMTVTPATINDVNGTFAIDDAGNYTFTPVTGFVGSAHYTYQVCDNGSPVACATATVYILVYPANTTPLPIKIIDFTGKAQNDHSNLLIWKAVDVKDMDSYEIRRSTDQKTWISLGSLPAENKAGVQTMHLVDNDPDKEDFYRLILKGKNGQVSIYPKVVYIRRSGSANESATVYPNPAETIVNFEYNSLLADVDIQVEIMDITGRRLKKVTTRLSVGKNTLPISLTDLADGSYIIRYHNLGNGADGNLKFIKDTK